MKIKAIFFDDKEKLVSILACDRYERFVPLNRKRLHGKVKNLAYCAAEQVAADKDGRKVVV